MNEGPANDDATLVALTLAGDRECFSQLYDRYARLVRAVARPAATDDAAMHDLVQDCFLRAYRGLHRLREPDEFGPWLVGIARQVASECRRKRRRDRHRFVGADVLDADGTTDPAELRERADDWRVVLDELARLPGRERMAIHTFFLQERGVAETARLLNLSRSGTYELLARACRRLATRLMPSLRTEEVKP
jgi:RNA polymerase sigma-70 factor (ECF subfamily)